MSRSIFALCAVLLAWTAVPTAAPAAAQELMTAPPPGMAAVAILQARPDQAGDRYRFESRTRTTVTGEGARTQVNRQLFDLEILAVEDGGRRLKMRYVLVEGELTDTSDPDGELVLKAWMGVPMEFDANAEGLPMAITNWPAVRAAFLANHARLAPGRTDMRANIERYFDNLERNPPALAQMILGDPRVLAGMQPREPIAFGRIEAPPEERTIPGGKVTIRRVMDLSRFHQDTCRAELMRETSLVAERGAAGNRSRLTTTAVVSAHDGWVISLEETKDDETPAYRNQSRVTIERKGSPAACPAAGRR